MDPTQITVSAFGKFGNIVDNPSSILLGMLDEPLKIKHRIAAAKVLEVSTVGCEEWVASLPKNTINIHLGVYDGSQQFSLEQCGYNCKDFGIADMRGFQPQNECIDGECEKDAAINCRLNLEALNAQLSKNFKVGISQDPGRYICNYIYYCSLKHSCANPESACLFVHVPSFKQIPKDVQFKFLLELFETINKLRDQNKLFI